MGLEKAIENIKHGRILDPIERHNRVKSLYNWVNVGKRTEFVYNKVAQESVKSLAEQLRRCLKTEVLPWLLVISLTYIILKFLSYITPEEVS